MLFSPYSVLITATFGEEGGGVGTSNMHSIRDEFVPVIASLDEWQLAPP